MADQLNQEPEQQDPPSKKLYDGLYSDGSYTKSYDDFKKQFSDPGAIDKLYKGLSADKSYTKSRDEFSAQFFPEKTKAVTVTPTPATPVDMTKPAILDEKINTQVPSDNTASGQMRAGVNDIKRTEAKDIDYHTNVLPAQNAAAAEKAKGQQFNPFQNMGIQPKGNTKQFDNLLSTNLDKFKHPDAAVDPDKFLKADLFSGQGQKAAMNMQATENLTNVNSQTPDPTKVVDLGSMTPDVAWQKMFGDNHELNLRNYYNNRVNEINQQIKDLSPADDKEGAQYGTKAYADKIEYLKTYKDQLTQAANSYFDRWAVEKAPGDPKAIDRQQRLLAGDPTVHNEIKDEQQGVSTTQEQEFNKEFRGISIMQNNLATKAARHEISEDEYNYAQGNLDAARRNLINKYPQYRDSQIGKVVAQAYGNDGRDELINAITGGKDALSSFMKRTGISKEDIKHLSLDDIPQSSMLGNIGNELAGGVAGIETGLRRIIGTAFGADPREITRENQDISQGAATLFGSNPYNELKKPQSIVDTNNDAYRLQDIANPEAGRPNYTGSAIKGAIGSGLGQLAQFILLSKGLGAASKAVGLTETAYAADKVGMYGTVMLGSYENNYQAASHVMGEDASEGAKNLYALFMGGVQAAAFEFLPHEKINTALGLNDEAAIKSFQNIVKDKSLQNINKEALETWTDKAVKNIIQSTGETAKVTAAGIGATAVQHLVNAFVGTPESNKNNLADLSDEIKQQITNAPFHLLIPLGLAGIPQAVQHSRFTRESLYDMGLNSDVYNRQLHEAVVNGDMTIPEMQQKSQVVDAMSNIVNSMQGLKTADGKKLTHAQSVEYAYQRVKEVALKAKADGAKDDKAMSALYKEQTDKLVENRKAILGMEQAEGLNKKFEMPQVYDNFQTIANNSGVAIDATKVNEPVEVKKPEKEPIIAEKNTTAIQTPMSVPEPVEVKADDTEPEPAEKNTTAVQVPMTEPQPGEIKPLDTSVAEPEKNTDISADEKVSENTEGDRSQNNTGGEDKGTVHTVGNETGSGKERAQKLKELIQQHFQQQTDDNGTADTKEQKPKSADAATNADAKTLQTRTDTAAPRRNGKSGDKEKAGTSADSAENIKVLRKRNDVRNIKHPAQLRALDVDSNDPHDLVKQYFIRGGTINPSAMQEIFGRKHGGKSFEQEKRARISLLGKDAPSIKRLAEKLWHESDQHAESKYTDQDFRDAIEETVTSHNSRTSMANELVKAHGDTDEKSTDPYEKMANDYYNGRYEAFPEHEQQVNTQADRIEHMSDADVNDALDKIKENPDKAESIAEDIINNQDKEGTWKPNEDTELFQSGDQARSLVEQARKQIPDITADEIHKQLKEVLPDITKEHIQKLLDGENAEAAIKESASRPIGKVSAKNVKGLYEINRNLFGLDKTEAAANSIIMDTIIREMAKRKGITKEEQYKRLAFDKADSTGKNQAAIKMMEAGKAIIYALRDPNVSSPLHELAHAWEKVLTPAERAEILNWAGHKGWNRSTSEAFARGFEKYLADGKAPTPLLQKIFGKFKSWLTDIYNGITGSQIDFRLSNKMQEIYGQMLGASDAEIKTLFDQLGDKAEKLAANIIKNVENDVQPTDSENRQNAEGSAAADTLPPQDVAGATQKPDATGRGIQDDTTQTEGADDASPHVPVQETDGRGTPTETGIKNKVTLKERRARDKDAVEVLARRTFKGDFERGKDAVDKEQIDPEALAEEMSSNPRPLSSLETIALIYGRMKLHNQHAEVSDLLEKAIDEGHENNQILYRRKLETIEQNMDINDEAARRTGYEQGYGLAIRRMMMQQDYSEAAVVQKMKNANLGKISEPLRKWIGEQSEKLKAAEEALQKHNDAAGDRAIDAHVKDIVKGVKKSGKKRTPEEIRQQRTDLVQKFKDSFKKPDEQTFFQSAEPLQQEQVKMLRDMAKSFIEEAYENDGTELKHDEVVDMVHEAVGDTGLDKREIADGISGYGKTSQPSKDEVDKIFRGVKTDLRLVSALEDVDDGEAPKRTGYQREKPTDEQRRMRKEIDRKMKEMGIEAVTRTPEENLRTALDAVKARLRNHIADLEHQLETGEKTPKPKGVEYDKEAQDLVKYRNELKAQLAEIEGKPEMSDEQKINNALKAAERSTVKYLERIAKKDFSPEEKKNQPTSPELKGAQARRDEIKDFYNKLKKEAQIPKDKNAAALKMYKTRLLNQHVEAMSRLMYGDFSKTPKRTITLDKEAIEMKASVENIKATLDAKVHELKLKNRSNIQKLIDGSSWWKRQAVLTGIPTIGKIAGAASTKLLTSPFEELIGAIWSQVPGIHKISAEAPREGHRSIWNRNSAAGGLLKSEVGMVNEIWDKKTFQQMWQALRTGQIDIDREFGKAKQLPPEIMEMFGHAHSALKSPQKRAEWMRSYLKRMQYARMKDFDTNDEVVQHTIGVAAYLDANRSIFLQDNAVTKMYQMAINYAKNATDPKISTPLKTAAWFAQQVMPIVKVPTNFALETAMYSGSGLPKALVLGIKAMVKGTMSLSEDQRDFVIRALKKGSVGIPLIILGYNNPQAFGGYYTGKRKEGDLDAGDIKFGDFELPHWLAHTPLAECLQIGATLRRAMDSQNEKNESLPEDKQSSPFGTGARQAIQGVLGHVPFFDTPKRFVEALGSNKAGERFTGEFLASNLPLGLKQIANFTDKNQDDSEFWEHPFGDRMNRKEKSFKDYFKMYNPLPWWGRRSIDEKEDKTKKPLNNVTRHWYDQ